MSGGWRAAVADVLLTARRVAEIIGVSTETVLRYTREGKLPGIELPGGAKRYREDVLEQWLTARETSPASVTLTRERPAA